ncbi:MAG: transglycosylase SLT domain-containing protein [Pseudomonadota bacterium]
MKRLSAAVLAAILLPIAALQTVSATPVTSPDDQGCANHIRFAELEYGIPEGLLMAIGVTESRLNPLALNHGGRTLRPASFDEAANLLVNSAGEPYQNMAIGCMQIFARFHLDEVDGDPQQFLDPATNVDYAARLLLYLYRYTGNWRDAVGRYHTSPTSPNYVRYICVIDRQMAALDAEPVLGCAG